MVDIVKVGLSVDSKQVDKGTRSLDKLGKQAKKTETATDKMSNAFKVGMVAAMATASVAIVKSIQLHREFTKSISELSAITGAAGEDLEFFRKQALKMGESTTFSASQVAIAFKLIASAKPDLLESKEALAAVTKEVLTLAEASGLDLPQAANALGSSLNQFGAGAGEANRFINVLAAGAKFGASEINETAEAMKNVGAVASSIGLSFEQTNSAIQALAAVSIKGAEAGTGLRGVLLKLAKQSRDEFNPEIVGLENALKNLKNANLTTTEKMNLFGLESATAATALISQADAVGELTKKLTGTNTATEQAAINVDNLDGDIKRMESAWEGVALMLGDTFDPALRGTVDLMTTISKIAKTVVLTFKDLGNKIGATAAQLVSLASLDFAAVTAIGEARDANAKKLEEEYNLIWNINGALDKQKELEKVESEAGGNGEAETAIERSEAKIALAEETAQRLADIEFAAIDQQFADLDRMDARKKWSADFERNLFNQKMSATKGFLGNMSTLMSSNSKKEFELGKKFALANALVKGYEAVTSSYAAGAKFGGPILGGLFAGAAALATKAQINNIQSQSFGGGGSLSVSGGAGGGVSTGASFGGGAPTPPPIAAPEAEKPVVRKELRVSLEGRANTQEMRDLIMDLEETASNMGSDTRLVLA